MSAPRVVATYAACMLVYLGCINVAGGASFYNEARQFHANGGASMQGRSLSAGPRRTDSLLTGRGENQSTSSPSYPPVWIRIPLAVVLGLGSNPMMVWGIWNLDNGRRRRGCALCCAAVAMFIGGISLMLLLAFPATWGWWI